MVRTSKLYEEHYVDPQNVELEFKEKRNLIHIYLESVENTYLSKEDGGQEENNYIKELGELAKENINFSHSNKIGGSYTIEVNTMDYCFNGCTRSGNSTFISTF